ncbi:hypothetical protein BLAT2472_40200 [Burkholderia latens]
MPRVGRRMHAGGQRDVRRSPYANAYGDFYMAAQRASSRGAVAARGAAHPVASGRADR